MLIVRLQRLRRSKDENGLSGGEDISESTVEAATTRNEKKRYKPKRAHGTLIKGETLIDPLTLRTCAVIRTKAKKGRTAIVTGRSLSVSIWSLFGLALPFRNVNAILTMESR